MSTVRAPSRRRERGLALVLGAVSMLVIIAVAAVVTDLGYARQRSRQEQGVTDAAALAGAADLPSTSTPDPAMALAGRDSAFLYAQESLELTSGWSGPTCVSDLCTWTHPSGNRVLRIETPCTTQCTGLTGGGVEMHNLVWVEDCSDNPTFLAQTFGASSPRVCREAVARHLQTRESTGIGLISLDPTASCAINVNGTNDITVEGGAVIANSTAATAICGTGGSSPWFFDAVVVSTVGGVDPDVVSHTTGTVLTDQNPVPNPFDPLPDDPCEAPAATSCGGSPARPTAIGSCNSPVDVMTPGYFGATCDLGGGNSTVNMAPGVYWFEQSFDPKNHDVRCPTCTTDAGILMFFQNGTFSHTGNGTVTIPPYAAAQPAGSTYAGLSIYQREGNTTPMEIGGTSGDGLGSIYARDALVGMHGTPDRHVEGLVVASTFDFDGNGTIVVDPPPAGPALPRVVELALSR